MKKYIELVKAIESICNYCQEKGDCHGECAEVMDMKAITTADVQEVKHGKWIDRGWHSHSIEGEAHFYKCSICLHKQIGMSKYCPHCGARMDGEEDA